MLHNSIHTILKAFKTSMTIGFKDVQSVMQGFQCGGDYLNMKSRLA